MQHWTEDIDRRTWLGDLDGKTAENTTFRTVLSTGRQTQLTVMSIRPGEDIGWEVHRGHDQFLRIVEGRARVELGPNEAEVEQTQQIGPGWAVIVPAGVWHNVVNTGEIAEPTESGASDVIATSVMPVNLGICRWVRSTSRASRIAARSG